MSEEIKRGEGYVPNEWLHLKPSFVNKSKWLRESRSDDELSSDGFVSKEKFLEELNELVRNPEYTGANDVYEDLRDRKMLPEVYGGVMIGFDGFRRYYSKAREAAGLKKYSRSKKEFIRQHYTTWTVDALSQHLGTTIDYVRQKISQIKRENKNHG